MRTKIIKPTAEDYTLTDVFHVQRWMCSNCGLILDFQFDPDEVGWPEFEPPLHESYWGIDEEGNEYNEEPERRELCPRCKADFGKVPLVPVTVEKYAIGAFSKITFVVEDNIHKSFVQAIAGEFKKDVGIEVVGNSSNVVTFFKFAKSQQTLANGYFVIDGDNRNNIYPREPNFIHLDKYCMENYLLDFKVCASISKKTIKQIRSLILGLIQSEARISGGALSTILFNRLSANDITAESLKNADASKFFPRFVESLGMSQDEFIKSYVARCYKSPRREDALPARIVEIIEEM